MRLEYIILDCVFSNLLIRRLVDFWKKIHLFKIKRTDCLGHFRPKSFKYQCMLHKMCVLQFGNCGPLPSVCKITKKKIKTKPLPPKNMGKRKSRNDDEDICAYHGTRHRGKAWGSKFTLNSEEKQEYSPFLKKPEYDVVCAKGKKEMDYRLKKSRIASSSTNISDEAEEEEDDNSGFFKFFNFC